MSVFEKLGFKKKKEADEERSFPLMDDSRADLPPMRSPSMPRFDTPDSLPPGRPSFEQPQPREDSRGIDLINAKLDAIKAILDNINARIERLEKIAAGEEETPRWR